MPCVAYLADPAEVNSTVGETYVLRSHIARQYNQNRLSSLRETISIAFGPEAKLARRRLTASREAFAHDKLNKLVEDKSDDSRSVGQI
jgi:hypothetical protein